MIDIGYKFPHNGATVLGTAPAGNDSIIVLCKESYDSGRIVQWITGRVYVHQLPRPESWEAGTYSDTIEGAVEHFAARSGLETGTEGVPYLSALIRNFDKRLAEVDDARTFHVEDNVTGARVSKDFPREESASSICAAMNTPNSGGRYGVYDQNGVRAL